MYKENLSWNYLNQKNIGSCLSLTNDYDFGQLKLHRDLESFLLDLSADHRCDPKVLFFSVLAGIGHFSESMNVYNLETKQLKPITVYEILIAPSGELRGLLNSFYLRKLRCREVQVHQHHL